MSIFIWHPQEVTSIIPAKHSGLIGREKDEIWNSPFLEQPSKHKIPATTKPASTRYRLSFSETQRTYAEFHIPPEETLSRVETRPGGYSNLLFLRKRLVSIRNSHPHPQLSIDIKKKVWGWMGGRVRVIEEVSPTPSKWIVKWVCVLWERNPMGRGTLTPLAPKPSTWVKVDEKFLPLC
jgi:hypothetical protein